MHATLGAEGLGFHEGASRRPRAGVICQLCAVVAKFISLSTVVAVAIDLHHLADHPRLALALLAHPLRIVLTCQFALHQIASIENVSNK